MDFYSGNSGQAPISSAVLNSLLRHLQDDAQFYARLEEKHPDQGFHGDKTCLPLCKNHP
jgi:hypothetical protein